MTDLMEMRRIIRGILWTMGHKQIDVLDETEKFLEFKWLKLRKRKKSLNNSITIKEIE